MQMDISCNNVESRNRQKENWSTEEPMGRHVQDGCRRTVVTNIQYPVRMEYIHTTSAKVTFLGTAQLRPIHTKHAVPLPCSAAKGLECVFPI